MTWALSFFNVLIKGGSISSITGAFPFSTTVSLKYLSSLAIAGPASPSPSSSVIMKMAEKIFFY